MIFWAGPYKTVDGLMLEAPLRTPDLGQIPEVQISEASGCKDTHTPLLGVLAEAFISHLTQYVSMPRIPLSHLFLPSTKR